MIINLAEALGLTTVERRQLLLAASGLDDYHVRGNQKETEEIKMMKSMEILDKLMDLLGQLRFPAYIQDVFGEHVAVNASALKMYQIAPEIIEKAGQIPGGYTTLRLLFGNVISSVVSSSYEKYLLNSIRALRQVSLRYRAHPYFQYLMKEFRDPKKYPGFERYWRHAGLVEEDKDIEYDIFEFSHVLYGNLKFVTSGLIPSTPHGELIFIYNIPLDEHTSDVFEQLAVSEGTKAFRFAPWPEKKMV